MKEVVIFYVFLNFIECFLVTFLLLLVFIGHYIQCADWLTASSKTSHASAVAEKQNFSRENNNYLAKLFSGFEPP